MGIAEGRAYFRSLGMEDRVQEFTVSSATVELAAAALGVEGARIAKTLSFKTADGCMLILAAGDARIDNHKFKERFHFKAKMLSAEEVLELVGHPVGGVCPFGTKPGIPVYLDESLKRFVTVFPEAKEQPQSQKIEAALFRCSHRVVYRTPIRTRNHSTKDTRIAMLSRVKPTLNVPFWLPLLLGSARCAFLRALTIGL